MLRIGAAGIFVLLLSSLGFAQIPGGNVFFGYSYLNVD